MQFQQQHFCIHIFVKGLCDAHNTTAKIYEKDPQTLSEVISPCQKVHYNTPGYGHSDILYSEHDIQWWLMSTERHDTFVTTTLDVQCYNCEEFGHFA